VLSLGSLGSDVRFAFTSRVGGVSAPPYDGLNLSTDVGDDADIVERNRRAVLDRVAVAHAAWLHAQHGRVVDRATGPDGVHQADGLVSTMPGLAIAALSADCALVVLADPTAGVVGCLHCGRAGLVAGVVDSMVAAMHDLGATSIRAAIGPTICGTCYQVPAEMAAAVVAVVPAARSRSGSGSQGGAALDIRAGVLDQLTRAGVAVVRLVGGCTLEDPSCFSYRRDGRTGRMAALVWAGGAAG
jgi:polyphenol oxidase